jgi:AmmeMemoRadiSam system protein B
MEPVGVSWVVEVDMRSTTHAVRHPAVAGSFYPADPSVLIALVDRLLDAVAVPKTGPPAAVIVPHAGFRYSGETAAVAYALVRSHAARYHKVVVVGPSHFVPFPGVAVPECGVFGGPLGEVPVDEHMVRLAVEIAGVQRTDLPHLREHSLEVQFPFLTAALGTEFSVLPVVSGDGDPQPGSNLIDRLLDDDARTLIVVSSDLSHYLPYEVGRSRDERTARCIEVLRPEQLDPGCACGRVPIAAILAVARRRRWRCRRLDLRSSGDTAGDRERVVGSGAFALGPEIR